MKEYKNGCLPCGKEFVYLTSPEKSKCVYCNMEFEINEYCIVGHLYVINATALKLWI